MRAYLVVTGLVVAVGAGHATSGRAAPAPVVRLAWGTPARGAAAASRPLYFQRIMTKADLEGRSVGELGLMRDAILARARELSAIDRKNLAGIALWEKRARALEGLQQLAPGFDAAASNRTRYECGANARGVLRDKREERQLFQAADRMSWAAVPDYGDYPFRSLGPMTKVVGVACGPDIDVDGAPEAIVMLYRSNKVPPDQDPGTMYLFFLASRHGTKWSAVAPLGFSGSIAGIEGSITTESWFVTLADGRRALAVRRTVGGGGDCDCHHEETSVATLEQGKLQPQGTFETGRPCECQYDDPATSAISPA
jgi:hypothetical protein